MSGAMATRLAEYGQDYAANEYQNYLNRLSGQASSGQNAAGMLGAAGQYYGTSTGNALSSIGNAQSAGAIASGNAWTGALNNIAGSIGYQNALSGGSNNANLFSTPWAASGFWG